MNIDNRNLETASYYSYYITKTLDEISVDGSSNNRG